ncbi:NAD(P)H-binding protein [Gordonia rubripertincta]|jgi:uncharacterized protein YbjT (DUF2867 family)|uniref:NAD(P)H-binding protein n=1 Tax=Gordonia rubripertincta TaxID=36822 RepID=A0ABT4MT49_GORRU|nr:NAD(P)H-binding protein [Gordonia rubripertincta]MCZ4550160.1 NAD(P)H-binding protein [Gordonia rubripertincta]
MHVLVLGATGYIGSRLIPALLDAGHEVVAASRNLSSLERFGWVDDVKTIEFNASDPESVRAGFAAAGHVDVVYYLVHGIGEKNFRDIDRRAAENVAAGARSGNVGRIVYLGGFVPDDAELSEHLESRAEVGEALDLDGGAELVWLKAAVVIGAGSTSFEMVRYISDRLAVIPLPTWVDNPMDPISVRDAVYYLAAAATDEVPPGSYDITSADTGSYSALLFAYLRAIKAPRVGVVMPSVDVRLAGFVSGLLVPVPSGLASDLVRSLDYPMKASEHTIRDHVPDPPGGLLTVRQAVELSVASGLPRPVNELPDIHHLADTDPSWAGGDLMRVKREVRDRTVQAAGVVAGLINAVRGAT